jgi:chromate transporter
LNTRRDLLSRIADLAWLFLKLGFIAFGGPAAHIAMFRQEVVVKRKWLDDQEFLDLIGVTNLIPGPNSTEMVIHIGLQRAGWIGFLLAGTCFIAPAMVIVMVLSWFYVYYGTTPQAASLLAGVKPVVIVIIVQAFWGLGRKAIRGTLTALTCLAALVLYFLNVHPILVLLVCGLVVMVVQNVHKFQVSQLRAYWIPWIGVGLSSVAAVPFSLGLLFLTFLKIGAVLYGSGYVLFAFLHADFVTRLGWLTSQQLVDAIAVGQITPGPLFTSATFIGYILAGIPGAILGTLGIFLPSFVFVALSSAFIPRIRSSLWLGSLLDGVNVASLGMMVGVTWQLASSAMVDPATWIIAILTGFLLLIYNVNTTWLILAGAAAGIILKLG